MGDAASPPSMWKAMRPFVLGGASGMAATVAIQPIDMIKVQKQLAEGAFACRASAGSSHRRHQGGS
jgi:hypothetical protein